MATQVKMPKLGQTMEKGTIVQWLKGEGDPVARGDVLFELESDKAVLEEEARAEGVLRKILIEAGQEVPVLTPVAIIAEPDEDIEDLLTGAKEPQEVSETEAEEAEIQVEEFEAETVEERERIFASPRARKLAREQNVDLARIEGSGPRGRIVEADVEEFLARRPKVTPAAQRLAEEAGIDLMDVSYEGSRISARDVRAALAARTRKETPPAPVAEPLPLEGLRGIVAERMGRSAHTTAAVTLQRIVDATELVAVREKLKAAYAEELGFSIGYNDLLAVMVARCLVELPYMNVQLVEDGVRQMDEVNVGMAVDSERGLLVPVVHGVDEMGVKEFAVTLRELVARARSGKSLPDDLSGGTFTITNLGMFGVDAFTPIINLPECAILGVGRIKPQAAVVDGQVCVCQQMWLSLTVDHRLVDGAPAARFLDQLARYVENPYLLLA